MTIENPKTPLRLLLVEDSPSDAALLQENILSSGGEEISVSVVPSLHWAIDHLKNNRPDAVLLDLTLPDSVGLGTVKKARGAAPDAPIVVLTGVDDEKTGMAAMQAGVQDYLVKGQADGRAIIRAVRYAIERKRSEEALRQSEERYRHLVKHAPAGIYEVDFTTGHFTEVNDVMCRILGYTREELLSMTAFDVLDEEDRPRFAARIGKAQSGDRPEEAVEYRVRTRDGRLIWGLLNVTFRREGDKIVGATVVAHDITARKTMEDALRESELRFKAIAETTPVGVGVVGLPEAKFLYVNSAYVQSFGYSESEVLGKGTPDIYWNADDRERLLAVLKEKGSVTEYEVKFKRKDGTPFWGLSSIRPITYNGRPALLGAYVDITARKKSEEALRESEARFRAIFENSIDAVGVSKAGIHVTSNPAYLALFGFSPEELIGKPIADLIALSERPIVAENVRRRARGEPAPSGYETIGLRKDGTEFDVDTRVSTYTEGGEVFSVVVMRDITERKRIEGMIRQSVEELRASNEELERFNLAMVDREARVIELKKEVNELRGRLGEPAPYKVDFEEEQG